MLSRMSREDTDEREGEDGDVPFRGILVCVPQVYGPADHL